MQGLIPKLEKMNVGSLSLDGIVAAKLGWHSNPSPYYAEPEKIRWSPPDTWGGGPWGTKLPRYTTDHYAVLTLLPENWGWLLEIWQHEKAWAQVVQRDEDSSRPSGIFAGAEANTPELAFLCAVLKARLNFPRGFNAAELHPSHPLPAEDQPPDEAG